MVNGNSQARESIVNRILTTIADNEDVDETELPPLYDTIDPNALKTLFRDGSGKVMFEYCDYLVTVDHEYSVEVTPLSTE